MRLGGPHPLPQLFMEAHSVALIGVGALNLWEPHSKPSKVLLVGWGMIIFHDVPGEVPQRSCSWVRYTDPALFLVAQVAEF